MKPELSDVAAERGYREVRCNQCGADDPRFRYKLLISSIVACGRCGLCYVTPRAGSEWLQARLEEWARTDTVDEERLRIAFDKATMALYSRYLAWTRRVLGGPLEQPALLDIGCSVGAFLTQAAASGYRVSGLEVGSASAGYARDARGLDVACASVYDADFPPGEFDIVSMLEVIEHLEDPKGAISRVAEWIRPGGALLLTTPNFDSLYRKVHGARWWVVNCEDEHIYFFTIDSLSRMLDDIGLDVKLVATRGFDLQGLVKQLFTRRHLPESDGRPAPAPLGYYETRRSKERIKALFRRLGLLSFVRSGLRGLDWLASQHWSPLFGLGEQIIVIAVRRG